MRLNYTRFFSRLSPAFGDLLRRISQGVSGAGQSICFFFRRTVKISRFLGSFCAQAFAGQALAHFFIH